MRPNLPPPDDTGRITTSLHRLHALAEVLYALEPFGTMQPKDSPAHWEAPIKAYRALPLLLEATDCAYTYRRALAEVATAIREGRGAQGLVDAENAGFRLDEALLAVAESMRGATPEPTKED